MHQPDTKSYPAKSKHTQRIIFIGDIVGKPGLDITIKALPFFRKRLEANLIIANAENVAEGTGLRVREYRKLIEAGVDAITLGDHIYKKREIIEVLNQEANIVRPANFPTEAPGKRYCCVTTNDGLPVVVMSLLGRVFMRPVDCPFHEGLRLLDELDEAEQTLARLLDGRVSAIIGTHTHVTTADQQILPGGTGFQCDVGMTGSHESILGRDISAVVQATLTFEPVPFDVASADPRVSATCLDVCPATGKTKQIFRIQVEASEI
jgi:2',3'-cyclic-nucleotide 2'-phosphodiesterase